MKRICWIATFLTLYGGFIATHSYAQEKDSLAVHIRKTEDFQVSGKGDHVNWTKTPWLPITIQESAGRTLTTNTKLLYSATGIYVLFQCEDQKLSASIQEDFTALFKEDVVEVFIWPDPSVPIYFEYELSPLNYELAVLVPNINGKFQGWKPWNYKGGSRTQHATSVQGGDKTSNASISGWTAEVFIPYRLLYPIVQSPPTPGTRWRGNLYRIDYDNGYTTWSWRKTSGSFHEFDKYGTWIFD